MPKTSRLLGLAAVGVSLLGVATAYWRRNHTPAPIHPTSVQVSHTSATPPPNTAVRRQPTKFQEEQIAQVKNHE
jgi:hypothetical protein